MILVTGAGGFIGGHLVKALEGRGLPVCGVDIKPVAEWWQKGERNLSRDLRDPHQCANVVRDCTGVFNLACDMGGMGYIESHKSACMLNVLINTNLLLAAERAGVNRYFYASTACVYNTELQQGDAVALTESQAYPAMPEDGYGWEKLFSERLCERFGKDTEMETRIGRFHTIYGPHGTYVGGREKVVAALCRKVALAKRYGDTTIEVWGDGTQQRSMLYVDDAVDAVLKLTRSSEPRPRNIGGTAVVTVEGLLKLIESIAKYGPLERIYDLSAPRGVQGRSSDNSLMYVSTGWEPSTTLRKGVTATYRWISDQLT